MPSSGPRAWGMSEAGRDGVARDQLPVVLGVAVERLEGLGALHVQVQIVFPGEPDASVHLDGIAAHSISAEAHTAARRRRDSRREAAPPGWPMMASAPTATLSSRSSDQRFVRSMPFIGESVTPTLFGSRRKSERPSAERAGTRMTSATCAHGTKRFTPERIQPLPDLVALAVVEAGSQSRCSSSSAAVIRARPEAMAGSHLSFCSAEPPSMSPSPPRTTVEKKGPGYAAR